MIILPKELLSFKRRRDGLIETDFITDTRLATELYSIWRSSCGLTLREIKDEFSEFEDFSNYKKVRGIFYVLMRLSKLSRYEDARKIRELLFSMGPVLDTTEREKIIKMVSDKFGEDINSMKIWGDLDIHRVLIEPPALSPDELCRIYNLALLLGITTMSHKVFFSIERNIGDILRYAKRLGLMYDVSGGDDDQDCLERGMIALFGPASIIKETQRYGVSLARVLAKIVSAQGFYVIIKTARGILKLSHRVHSKLFPQIVEEEKFDSSYEYELFMLLKDVFPNVKVLREPEAFFGPYGVFLPDFKMEGGEKELFIEVVGYWTPDYIKRKIEKLRYFGAQILLIASEDFVLSVEKENICADNLIVFSKRLPLLEIIKKIRGYFGNQIDKKKDIGLGIGGTERGVIQRIESGEIEAKVRDEISSLLYDGMDFSKASEIIKNRGFDVRKVLSVLGYDIEWECLMPPKGRIRRRKNK